MLASIESNIFLVSFFKQIILSYYVSENYCTVVYYDQYLLDPQKSCNQYCKFLLAIEEALIQLDAEHAVMWITSTQTSEKVLESAIEQGCQSYIVTTRDVRLFLEMKLMIKENTLQRIRDRNFLLFVDEYLISNDDWITIEAMKFYPNLWFAMPSGDDTLDFYSQDYSITNTTKLQLLQSYNVSADIIVNDNLIFYDKLFDLGGRTIPMGVAEYVPYCTTTNVGENNGNVDAFNSTLSKELYLEGLEGSLIVEFCRNRNCNILLWPYGPSDWGDIFANGSGYGEIYSVYTKQTEFSICCLYYNWFLHLLDGSQYVAKSTITALVPGAKILPTSLTVIYPFSNALWLSVFIMLIIMTGVHHLITSLNLRHLDSDAAQPEIEKSIFDMISIYLDQGIFPNTISSSYRVLISFILLSGVVLSNSYASGLASVLTIPRYGKSIETIHEFAHSPYRWGAPAIAWILSLIGVDAVIIKRSYIMPCKKNYRAKMFKNGHGPPQHDIQSVVDKFDIVPEDEQLYRRSLTGEYGLGVELLNGGSYAFGSFIREDNVRSFDILKEEFYFTYTIGYAQRGWPLMEYFNKFNLEAIQFGFVIHWEKRTVRKYLSHRVQEALVEINAGHNEDDEFGPLSTEHIVGPMIILGIGLLASIVVFVCELIVFSLCRQYKKMFGKKSKVTHTRIARAPKRF